MKYLLLFTLLLACFFFSCREERVAHSLVDRAETFIASNPDSAYVLLDSIPLPDALSDPLLSRWCMLYGKAADKLRKDMPYVSQLNRAFKWYKKHGTPEEQAQIGLFLGRSYVEDKHYLQAADVYLEALAIAKEAHLYNVAGYICSYMADLYNYTGQISEERRKAEETAMYFEKAGNKKSYAIALRDIAKTWAFDDSCSLALAYLLKADSIATQLNDTAAMITIANGLGNVYDMMGAVEMAKNYLLKSISYNSLAGGASFLALSGLYYTAGKLDTARYYLNKVDGLIVYNPNTPIDALYTGYLIEEEAKDFPKALDYLEKYVDARDSLYSERSNLDIIDAEKRYNQLLLLNENNKLQISKYIYLTFSGLLLIVCLLVLIFYQRKDRKRLQWIHEQQLQLDFKENKLRILNRELKNKEGEQKDPLYAEIDQILKSLYLLMDEKFGIIPIVKKIRKQSTKVDLKREYVLMMEDWVCLSEAVGAAYPHVSAYLIENPDKLTQSELEICYLCFLQLKPGEEATLLGINPESVSRRRLRTRQKFDLVSTNTELYDFLIKKGFLGS